MKKLIFSIAAALMLVACGEDFTYPPVVLPDVVEVNTTTTIAQFKDLYWGTLNAPATIEKNADGEDFIFTGRVCSSDESGNIYKNIIIQGKDENGEQVALTFAVNNTSLYKSYPFGQEVGVTATGLSIGGYSGLLQFGAISSGSMTFMAEDLFAEHVVRTGSGLPDPAKVDTTVTTVAELATAKADAASLRKWQSRLVRVQNVSFVDAGQPYAGSQTTNRYVVDESGARLNVRNSSYASFSGEILPSGTGDVVGILSYYRDDWQLLLNDIDGVIGFTPYEGPEPGTQPGQNAEPTGEGTADNPYNVAKALAVIAAGPAETEVYVKGIVSSISEIDTGTYGNATYNISDDGSSTTAQLIIYRGKGLGGAKFTATDQLAVGADVIVKGVLINYNGKTPEMSQGSQIVSYNGQTSGGGSGGENPGGNPTTGSGTGTQEDPYDCASIINLNPTSTQEAVATGVWAQGYIVGSIPTGGSSTVIAGTVFGTENAAASNLVVGPTPDCKDTNLCITVQLGSGSAARAALNLLDNPGNLGKKVAIKGDVMKYCGAPGLKNVSEFTLDGQSGGNTGGDTPNPPTGNAIYSSLEASLSALPSDWTIENTTLPEGATYIWNWKVYNGSGYLNGSAYVNGALTAEAYAISPVIDLTGATGCELNFEHAAKFQTTLRTLCGVVVREQGSTTWTPLTVTTWPEAGSWNFVPCTIDLAAYNGKKVQIAFKYGSNSTGADTWEIKNLSITGNK